LLSSPIISPPLFFQSIDAPQVPPRYFSSPPPLIFHDIAWRLIISMLKADYYLRRIFALSDTITPRLFIDTAYG
jgi:hypothetical protein